MTDHQHSIGPDVQRDVIALNLALLRGDAEAVNAILGHTECAGCLVIAAAAWGWTLAAWACGDNAESGGRGTVSEKFRAELAEVHVKAQPQLREA